MPVVEKVPVTTVDTGPHPSLDLPLCCACLFFQIEARFIKEKWERAEWERLRGKNTHAFFFRALSLSVTKYRGNRGSSCQLGLWALGASRLISPGTHPHSRASCAPGLEMNTDTPPQPRTILLAPQRHLLVSFDPPAEDWLSALVLVLGTWF